jgi:hypothetical protein
LRRQEVKVWSVDALSMETVRPRLREILVDCVEHGASVGKLLVHSAARRRGSARR